LRRLAPTGSPTFHAYHNNPPASVLDLGCGAGFWLLDTARTWRTSQFVGLDLVDVAVTPLTDGSIPNVRLVRGDFLKYALPFPDRQFELVRMANLSLCIPFPKWEFVFREVARVLAPGGRLELVDDQTFFPYGDAPIEEATESAAETFPHLATTPTANPLSPSTPTPTPRVPPPTPASGFFDDESDDEDEDVSDEDSSDAAYKDALQEPSDDEPVLPPTPDTASEHSSFTDAASTLVGSERGSVELKKLSLSGPPQLDFEPTNRPFSGVEHLVISIPPPEPLAVVDLTVEGEDGSESEGEMPPTPVPPRPLPSSLMSVPTPTATTPTSASASASSTFPAPSASSSTKSSSSAPPTPGADAPSPLPLLPSPAPAESSSSGPWTSKKAASRDMERVFVRMLATRYGLHPRPADALVPVLARVFCAAGASVGGKGMRTGTGRVERPTSMHLKLAPVGVEGREDVVVQAQGGREEEREREREKERERDKDKEGGGKNVRTWMTTVESEREKAGGGRKGKKEKERQWASEPPVPQGVSAKAAERLGITGAGVTTVPQIRRPPTLVESPEGSEEEEDLDLSDEFSEEEEEESPVSASASGQPKGRGPSTWVPPSEWDAPPLPSPSLSREHSRSGSASGILVSAVSSKTITAAASSKTITAASSSKTIKQFAFGASAQPVPPRMESPSKQRPLPPAPALTHTRGGSNASTASAISIASSSSSASSGAWSESDESSQPPRFAPGRVQHPGLILWPATFIPVPPQELEMHATKHMQTLLGCKPALAEFVGTFVDPSTGERVVSEDEFEDAVWDYEWLVFCPSFLR
jgi:SAM-dependent methyltransferase